jgi:uncharacterized protein YceK
MKKILLTIAVLAAILLMAGCAKNASLASGENNNIQTPGGGAEGAAAETAYTHGSDIATNIECIDDRTLELTLINIESAALEIADDIKFYVNTALDSTPDCGKTTLAPGESTTCRLDVAILGFTPTLVVETPDNNDVKKVSC